MESALSDAFSLDASDMFQDMECRITLNPISPRYLKEKAFDVFYLNSPKGALGSALHEIIHFFWFFKWKERYGDSEEEYEKPHLKWILSEMAVEPIMRDQRLSSINPYFPKENGGCVYPYFYSMTIAGKPILDILNDIYISRGIDALMDEGHALLLEHEKEI